MPPAIDILGMKFGRLLVLEKLAPNKHGKITWRCQCDCGSIIVAVGTSLRTGNVQSCGCLNKEVMKTRVRDKHPMWSGGTRHRPDGYVRIKADHPRSDSQGYVLEHIFVMEKTLGRPLNNGEVIHHCNGNTSDNRPENLMLFSSNTEHLKYHAQERKYARS